MKFLLPLMLVLATCWASDPIFDDVFPQSMDQVADNYRLSKDVIPTKYDIELEPIFEDSKESFTFKGKSTITLNIEKDTSTITFHSKELTYFERVSLKLTVVEKAENKTIFAKSIKSDEEKDFIILEFEKIIKKQKDAKLTLIYTGKINDNFRGFYRDSYQDKEGKKKWLAVTHFEPTSARQVFPCWDEPNFKAVFVISIKVPKINGYHALSNTRIETDKDKKDGITLFKPTPNMSPYLVAFAVSDFKALNNSEAFGVWANPTVEDTVKQFAHDYGVKTLEALKEFTTIDYYSQMSKMDQIAIPNFNAAMENWGLVTYRESGLLEPTKTTAEKRQAIATVVAHELSHQWFGNLVTCEWWDYIWLNEGFATFFQYYISDKVIPKVFDKENWRFMEQFVVKNVQGSSFVVDASSKTRPLNPKHSVQKPAQIQSLFDDIAYKKGASILHMMYGFLNETIFQKGIVKYLNDNKNKVVNPDVFFKSVEDSDTSVKDYLPKDVNLQTVMKNWTEESGYPVVSATWKKKKAQEEKGPNDEIELKQERFFLSKPANEDKTQWYIPINYVTQKKPTRPESEKMYWMIPEKEASIDKLNSKEWILLNHGQTGYYRVNYDISNWKLLATYLKTSKYININVVNRAQLIDDALNLARAGYLAYTSALPITQYLYKEEDYIPWYAAVRAFNYLDSVLLDGKNHTAYQMYVASKIKTFATKSNAFKDPKTSTHVEKLSQVLALNTACKYGLKECQDYVNKKFTEWLNDEKNEKNLNPDLRSGILCGALRKVDSEKWNKTLAKYKNIKDKDEKADILAGLGCASKEIAEIFLQSTLEKDPDIDIFSAMNSINAGNAESFDVLINFTNENIEAIRKADKDNTLLIAFLNKLSNNVVTTDQYAQLSLLVYEQLQEVEKQKFDGLSVLYKLAWIRSYRDEVEKWIAENCEVCQNEPGSASSIVVTSFVLITSLLLTRLY